MNARRLAALALAVGLTAGPPARAQDKPDKSYAPGALPIEARLVLPMTGSKTTVRLEVKNVGKHPAAVFPPPVNSTTLLVTPPGGEATPWGRCEENRPPDELGKGETKSWDIDLADHVKFTKPGKYRFAFQVGTFQSNEVTFVVDAPTGPGPLARARAEALLKILRAKQWDQAAPFVIVTTGKEDAETRRRMGIAPDATPVEVTAKVAAWFKGLYEKGPTIGDIDFVTPDKADKNLVLVTYRHEDKDGFNLRRVGDEWYYTLDPTPRK
jgi:hypothetical protein